MWLSPSVVTPAASEPLTLAEVKAQLRVTATDEDSLIGSLISAARDHVEKYTGTVLVQQTLSVACHHWCDLASLPIGPVQTVTVKYLDASGAEQTLDSASYRLISNGLEALIHLPYTFVYPILYCAPDAVRVTAVCGYDTLPPSIASAMMLLINQWFFDRSASSDKQTFELPHAVTALLSNHRINAF